MHALEYRLLRRAHGDAIECDRRLAVDEQTDLAVALADVIELHALEDGDPFARCERVGTASDRDTEFRVSDSAGDGELNFLVRGRQGEVRVHLALAGFAPHQAGIEALVTIVLAAAGATERGRTDPAD